MNQWRNGRTHPLSATKYIFFWYVLTVSHCSFNQLGGMICHDVFDCTADLVGQLNGNGQKGMLQIDAPPVENFWLRHWNEPYSTFTSPAD